MDATAFFGIEATGDDRRWRLPVVPELCSTRGALFGGVGLGAAIDRLEHVTGRSLVWATAQFLSFAKPPTVVELGLDEIVRGHHVTQARVVARVDGDEIFTVVAALGRRPGTWHGSWAIRPEVREPWESPPRALESHHRGTLAERLDVRLADARPAEELPGPPGRGNSALWVHLPDLALSAAALAIVGDYVPFGIGQALGERVGGNSLDNTLRVAGRRASEWILADVRVHAVEDGFGHGLVHLWAEDGTLLGTASQSTIVRPWER
ncbi:MAG: acyl-CoA thioesterase [Acidimicrobiia bacterium]